MDQQKESFIPAPRSEDGQEVSRCGKRSYETPELRHWGSIIDLTRGLKLGIDDLPIKGGTRVT